MARKPRATQRRVSIESANEQMRLDFESVLRTPQGRRVLWQIVVESGALISLGPNEPKIASWLEGRRDLGVYVMEWAERVDPHLVPQMMIEKANFVLEEKLSAPDSLDEGESDG